MTKFLAFIGWLVVTSGALWWAYVEQEGEMTYTIIGFVSTIVLLSIFSKKTKPKQETTIVYMQPENNESKKPSKSTKTKVSVKSKAKNNSTKKK